MERPPCWPEGCPCPNSCARALHERVVYGTTPLYGPWRGWRIAGDVLVSPDRDRIKPAQLRAMIFLNSRSAGGRRGMRDDVGATN